MFIIFFPSKKNIYIFSKLTKLLSTPCLALRHFVGVLYYILFAFKSEIWVGGYLSLIFQKG